MRAGNFSKRDFINSRMKYPVSVFALFLFMQSQAQLQLPYSVIPDYPESYTAESTTARMIDGLGFRYYWATDGLREQDLIYQPGDDARTTRQTLEHIHALSIVIVSSTRGEVQSSVDVSEYSFDELRKSTLENLKEASDILKSGDVKVSDLVIQFEGSDKTYSFWHQFNGPIADAIWHVGQVVSFRRSSGNPFNAKVNVFTGQLRN